MTSTPPSRPRRSESGEATRTLLSANSATQEIELASLARWLAASETASAQMVQRAREGDMPEAVEELQLVQSSMFVELAQILEHSVQYREGFGRFGEK